MSSHEEVWRNVTVTYDDKTGYLSIEDDNEQQVALFYVEEE